MNGSKSYQVAVIGSGAGGREAAFHAARNGLRVVLVESDGLGGTFISSGVLFGAGVSRLCGGGKRSFEKVKRRGNKAVPNRSARLGECSGPIKRATCARVAGRTG